MKSISQSLMTEGCFFYFDLEQLFILFEQHACRNQSQKCHAGKVVEKLIRNPCFQNKALRPKCDRIYVE